MIDFNAAIVTVTFEGGSDFQSIAVTVSDTDDVVCEFNERSIGSFEVLIQLVSRNI